MLGLADKAAVASGLLRFLRGFPHTDEESFASWLKRTGQTERAIRHFWEPVVVGALNDTFERCSVKYAGKVFHESFLALAGGRAAGSSFCSSQRVLCSDRCAGFALRCRCSAEVGAGVAGADSGRQVECSRG